MNVPNGKAPEIFERFETGDYLGVAELVIPNERYGTEAMLSTVVWDSRQGAHFDPPLALEDVWYTGEVGDTNFKVHKADFHIFGDEETIVTVSTNNLQYVRRDELSVDAITQFTRSYLAHPHLLCLRSFKNRRLEELALSRELREKKLTEAQQGFRVSLNGVIQNDI